MARVDVNKYPVLGIISILMCFFGLIMALYHIIKGLDVTSQFLEMVFFFKPAEVGFLDTYRILFALAVLLTACTALLVLFSDFVRTNARFTGLPTCKMCQGPVTCVGLMLLLVLILLAWIWIYRKVVHVQFAFELFYQPCQTDRLQAGFNTTEPCLDIGGTVPSIFPNLTAIAPVCGDNLKVACEQYIDKARPSYSSALMYVAIVIFSLFQFLMCTAANHAYSFYRGRAAVLAPPEQLSSSSSSSAEVQPAPLPPPPRPKRKTVVNVIGDSGMLQRKRM